MLKYLTSPKTFTKVPFFDPILAHVGFVVNNLALGQDLLRVPSYPLVTIISPMSHTDIYLVFWVIYGSRNRAWGGVVVKALRY
jgi:hypothetical protein